MKKGQSRALFFVIFIALIISLILLVWQFQKGFVKEGSPSITGKAIKEGSAGVNEIKKIYADKEDLEVNLYWADLSKSLIQGKDWESCGDWNVGEIKGDIRLTNFNEEMCNRQIADCKEYFCVTELIAGENRRFYNENPARWSLFSERRNYYRSEGYFVFSQKLTERHEIRLCCETTEGERRFCKNFELEPYC